MLVEGDYVYGFLFLYSIAKVWTWAAICALLSFISISTYSSMIVFWCSIHKSVSGIIEQSALRDLKCAMIVMV